MNYVARKSAYTESGRVGERVLGGRIGWLEVYSDVCKWRLHVESDCKFVIVWYEEVGNVENSIF